MKTKLIETTLEHKNWTGLTLRELIDLGRIYAGDRGSIMAFVKEANGEPKTINALTQYRAAVAGIHSMHGITA